MPVSIGFLPCQLQLFHHFSILPRRFRASVNLMEAAAPEMEAEMEAPIVCAKTTTVAVHACTGCNITGHEH